MNARAPWTTYSLVAMLALGAGGLVMGCTVTTGTVDDPNGGPGTDTRGDDDDDDTGDDDDADAGTDSGSPVSTCEGNEQDVVLISTTCQACLDTSCCGELKGCFNLDPGTDDQGQPNATCSEYGTYYGDCSTSCDAKHPGDDDAYNQCIEDECKIASGNPAIATAWDAILNCAVDKCAAACAE